MSSSTHKIYYLDGIRGMAALLVFLHHFGLVFYTSFYTADPNTVKLNGYEIGYGNSILSFLTNGDFLVYVFYVLSGYVLSRKYFQSDDYRLLISGAQRRFIRLYIPVAFTMLISYFFIKLHLYYNGPLSAVTGSDWWFSGMWVIPDPFQKLVKSLLYDTMFNGDSFFDTTLWTISNEFYGSLFVFALLALTHQTRNRPFMLLCALLCAIFTQQAVLANFILGISLNYTEAEKYKLNKTLRTVLVIFLLGISIIFGSYPTTGNITGTVFNIAPKVFLMEYYGWYHAISAYLFVLAFALSPRLQRSLSSRPFRFLGTVSFSVYLLHPIILGSFSGFLFIQLYQHLSYNQAGLIVFVATVTLCLWASWLMARYIDMPGMRLAKKLYERYAKKESLGPVTPEK